MDTLLRDAKIATGRLDVLAHAGRTADEDVIDAFRRYQRAQQHPNLVAVEPAVQDRNVLFLARDDVEDREPIDEPVLEFLECLEEHDVVGRAIAVEQEELAVRLARKRALDDRQDRRDAGPSGKADMDTPGAGRRDHAEASRRRHHVERVTALQIVRCPARKRATINLLDRDAYLAVVGPGADRI